ncbi:MAG: adenylate cyclase, partial [Verrucomicrobiota bacterium]
MTPKPFKRIPGLIALGVIVLVCAIRWCHFDFWDRLERMTYDMRAREALKFSSPVATNLGFVFIDEASIRSVWSGSLGYSFGLYWPRQVYGRVVQELADQGATAVAFDILFGELRPDHPAVSMTDGRIVESDEFFALQMRRASNTIIAVTKEVTPPPVFLTNALAPGDITTDKDSDGILRRVQAFRTHRIWHPAFQQAEADYGVDLASARLEPGRILLTNRDSEIIKVPLDKDGNFDLADFVGDKLPPGMPRKAKPFTDKRMWHMGVVLAALELKLDLAQAGIDLAHGRITLRGPAGMERVIPVDSDGYFYVDWSLPPNHPQLTEEAIQDLLAQNRLRLEGRSAELTNRWRSKLAVVGSSAVIGNNLTDRGATPLLKDTLLVSKHWNVANTVLTGRFIHRAPLEVELGLIALLGIVAAVLTWELRVLISTTLITLLALLYVAFAVILYIKTRYWIPLVLPLGGAMLMTYVTLMAWKVVFEQAEQRRIKTIFSKVVSPKIMHVLLKAESLALGGARREITVMFADVRGFTELTDTNQERVADYVRKNKLTGDAAEEAFDEQARETLETVNLYLGLVADVIIRHDATLDKFIGDCVMAFWGAPIPDPRHALACVQAAIDTQRAIYDLNRQRAQENKRR